MAAPRNAVGPLPGIVWNRGGNRTFGALDDIGAFAQLSAFAAWGYRVYASNYSGNCGSDGKDEFGGMDLGDVLAMCEMARRDPACDPDRVGMFGASRGGMMTYLALAAGANVRAAATLGGSADLESQPSYRPEMAQEFLETFGGSAEGLRARSAVRWPEKFPKNVPLLMLHGTADWRVSPSDSLRLASLLQKQGSPYRLVMLEGNDHFCTEAKSEAMRQIREWFDRFVRDRSPLPDVRPHGK